jgi:xylulokinase
MELHLVAGASCGIWENLEKAMDTLKIVTETLPEEKNKDKYDELYRIYDSLYPILKNTFDKLSAIP